MNGCFEVANSVNSDQIALTASLICDYNILPFNHYHLDTYQPEQIDIPDQTAPGEK